jgi:hypothetical protein
MVKSSAKARRKRRTRRRRQRTQRGGESYSIILQTRWGFGNQIIQYFIACAVQDKFKYPLYILPAIENVHNSNSTKDYRDFFTRGKQIDTIPDTFTNPYVADKNGEPLKIDSIPPNTNIHLKLLGHFIEVFEHILPILVVEFTKKLEEKYPNLQISKSMDNGFIHVRRGDHAERGWANDMEFFNKALDVLANTTVKKWYIFSDDIGWCKQQSWATKIPLEYIDEPDEKKALALMAQCQGGGIIDQSTLGWAAALFGPDKTGKVVASKGLINHSEGGRYIGPNNWIYLD